MNNRAQYKLANVLISLLADPAPVEGVASSPGPGGGYYRGMLRPKRVLLSG